MSINENDIEFITGPTDFAISDGLRRIDTQETTTNGGGSTGAPSTSTPTPRPLIPISCCVDDGTGRCAESSQCVEYLTVDGLCPSTEDTSFNEGGAAISGLTIQLIPCDPNLPPEPEPVPDPEPIVVVEPPEPEIETVVETTTVNRYRIRVFPGTTGGRVETTIDQIFNEGEVVNIRAVPARGNTFVNWTTSTGTVFSEEATTAFTVTSDLSLFANFSQPEEDIPIPPPEPPPPPPPPPVTWRSCIDGSINEGSPPRGYKISSYRGAGGGVCWEPSTEVGFNPSPERANFTYQRGSSSFPQPFEFFAENSSFGTSYKVTFNTNTDFFVVTPREFNIEPQSKQKINIEIKRDRIEQLGDGLTNFNLEVDIVEI
jgi:hypothetical protein